MPIRKHDPVSKESMKWVSPQNTICETIRKIYHAIDNEDARLNCRIATSMAKSMSAKLEKYKRNWRDGFFDQNEKFPVSINKKPIDVLFLCYDDNCNTGWRFWQCAKYLGLNTMMYKWKPHPFGYPQQAPIYPIPATPIASSPTTIMAPGIETLIQSSRVVHLLHSTYPMAPVNWAKTKVVVQHGGTVYRQHPDQCNNIFNQFADKSIVQCPDLLGLGAKDEHWIYYPVDTMSLKPDLSRKGKVPVVGHFPSNPSVKGTDVIESAVEYLKGFFDFEYVGSRERLPWGDNLKRMAGCDIIIEGCAAEQGDKVYGEWGNTAIEASALGCAVVTHCLSVEKYNNEYGDLPLQIANNYDELIARMTELLSSWSYIDVAKAAGRKWVEKNHSIPATANRLWDLVYKELLG